MALEYLAGIKYGTDPPKFPADSNGLQGLASGLVTGAAAGKDWLEAKRERKANARDAANPPAPGTSDALLEGLVHHDQSPIRAGTEQVPGILGSIASAFLKAPGAAAAGADPLFEVRKLTAEQSAKMKALEITDALQKREDALDSRAAMMNLGGLVNEALKLPDPATVQGQLNDYMARHPALFETPEGRGMMKRYDDALDRLDKNKVQERLLEQYRLQWGPEGTRNRIADLNAQTTLEKAKVQADATLKRTQIMTDGSIERAEIIAGVQRENAKTKAIRDRAGDAIYRSFLVQASAIKDSIDLTDAQKLTRIQQLEDEYLGRLRDASPVVPLTPVVPAPAIPEVTTPLTNAVAPPLVPSSAPPMPGVRRYIYRPK